ncbi:MAG: dephospho-CoA kinase [Pseudomonadota bacterium]
MTYPLTIVLTGGIGSGKSTIAKIFQEYDIATIDADEIAREICGPQRPILKIIQQKFGEKIISSDGSLDRTKLRHVIFKNKEDKRWLEQLLHPVIYQIMDQRLQSAKSPYVVLVIPLFFNAPPPFPIDRILLVESDEKTRKARLLQRQNDLSSAEIERIFQAQITSQDRLKKADNIIHNDADLAGLKRQVETLHKAYLQRVPSRHR